MHGKKNHYYSGQQLLLVFFTYLFLQIGIETLIQVPPNLLWAGMASTTGQELIAEEDSIDLFFEPELEDTATFIQPTPADYKWLFPADKNSIDSWKNECRNFILPVDMNMCYLPERGRFRSHRVASRIPHTGIDLYAHDSTDVLAAMGGTVIFLGDIGAKGKGKAFGWTIIIQHTDSDGIANNYYSIYAHINKKGIYIKNGDTVVQGQVIAKVGNTGNAARYPAQVHFEIRKTSDPLFAQIRLSHPLCKKKVQLFDPEVIYKREQLYAHIRNADSKATVDLIERNLSEADEFAHDRNILDYIEQVRQRLTSTSYQINDLKLLIAANTRIDGTVSAGIGNHYAARTVCDQTNSFTYFLFNPTAAFKPGMSFHQKVLCTLNKSKFKKHLKVEFSFNGREGVRLFYARSDGQISCLFYQNGRIVDKSGIESGISEILKYQDIAVLEFGNTVGFWKLDDLQYTRMVTQTQNLISYWAKGKEIVMFAGNGGIMGQTDSSALASCEPCPKVDFVVPGIFIQKLLAQTQNQQGNSDVERAAIIAKNMPSILSVKEAFDAQAKVMVDSLDMKLTGEKYSFEQLDTLSKYLDSLVKCGAIDSANAQLRADKINKFGATATYQINDRIWEALQNNRFDTAMDLFSENSRYFIKYSEEQYNQVFKRLEENDNTIIKTMLRPPVGDNIDASPLDIHSEKNISHDANKNPLSKSSKSN